MKSKFVLFHFLADKIKKIKKIGKLMVNYYLLLKIHFFFLKLLFQKFSKCLKISKYFLHNCENILNNLKLVFVL